MAPTSGEGGAVGVEGAEEGEGATGFVGAEAVGDPEPLAATGTALPAVCVGTTVDAEVDVAVGADAHAESTVKNETKVRIGHR